MSFQAERFVFKPGVAVFAAMQIIPEGLDKAVEISGAVEAAETPGSPLNELYARVYGRDRENPWHGQGDDIAEFAGRQCYRSWKKGRCVDDYIANIIEERHGSVFRHPGVMLQLTGISRSLSLELIRHGVGTAPSQESQRYVDAKDVRFVVPPVMLDEDGSFHSIGEAELFEKSCRRQLEEYTELQDRLKKRLKQMLDDGDYKGATSYAKRANEAARAVLGNAAETRMAFTMNLQSARHILSLRGTEYADLEIRRLAVAMLAEVRDYAPAFFRGVIAKEDRDGYESIIAHNGKL